MRYPGFILEVIISSFGESVKITAISAEGVTPPTMTVSGGDWTNGETVKNTVARYPASRLRLMRLLGLARCQWFIDQCGDRFYVTR